MFCSKINQLIPQKNIRMTSHPGEDLKSQNIESVSSVYSQRICWVWSSIVLMFVKVTLQNTHRVGSETRNCLPVKHVSIDLASFFMSEDIVASSN